MQMPPQQRATGLLLEHHGGPAVCLDAAVINLMLTRELGDPFRRDALKKPIRMLDKYKAFTVN